MRNLLCQYLAAICANLASLQSGLLIGWSSSALPILSSENSPLSNGPITIEQGSLVASIFALGAALGATVSGLIINRIGRKYALLLNGLLLVAGWPMLTFAADVRTLYISRFLAGIGSGGSYLCIPAFVAEISDKKIRGALGSFMILNTNLGIVLSYIIGAFFDYVAIPLVGFIIGVVFIIWMCCLRETPLYLLNKQAITEAKLSADFYNYEITLNDTTEYRNSYSEKKAESKTNDKGASFKDLLEPSTRRGILISTNLFFLSQFSGVYIFVNYASQIFEEAGAALHPNIAAIIVGCLQLLGSYASTLLVDRAGRRFLLSASAFGTLLALVGMGVFVYLKYLYFDVSSVAWIPIVCLSTAVCISAAGLRTIPYVVSAEILPQNIRGPFLAFVTTPSWIISFLLINYFPYAVEMINLHGCMCIFATSCLLFLLYTLLYVPETKGKSFEEIKKLLAGK